MPKSKRNKIVHLTQVKKKGKDHKEDLLKQLEQYVENFSRVYIFDFDQTKSDVIMKLRLALKDHGRIFSGKNSLVTLTLKEIAKKQRANYDELIEQVTGHRGLLFSDIGCDKLVELLDQEQPEFLKKLLGHAQIGAIADSSASNKAGTRKKSNKKEAPKSGGKREVKFVKM